MCSLKTINIKTKCIYVVYVNRTVVDISIIIIRRLFRCGISSWELGICRIYQTGHATLFGGYDAKHGVIQTVVHSLSSLHVI